MHCLGMPSQPSGWVEKRCGAGQRGSVTVEKLGCVLVCLCISLASLLCNNTMHRLVTVLSVDLADFKPFSPFLVVMEDASRGGTYTGTEPMGLLWSLRPIPGSRHGLR